jgi:hypothetical protein
VQLKGPEPRYFYSEWFWLFFVVVCLSIYVPLVLYLVLLGFCVGGVGCSFGGAEVWRLFFEQGIFISLRV